MANETQIILNLRFSQETNYNFFHLTRSPVNMFLMSFETMLVKSYDWRCLRLERQNFIGKYNLNYVLINVIFFKGYKFGIIKNIFRKKYFAVPTLA
jgi:hypothetical protein